MRKAMREMIVLAGILFLSRILTGIAIGQGLYWRKAEVKNQGTIIIPKDIFSEGDGLPLPIYVPLIENNSNAFFNDWRTAKEISGEKVRFAQEKLLENLATLTSPRPLERPETKQGPGATIVLGSSLIIAFAEAFEKNAFKITVQRSPQGDFRAVIQISTDEMNVIRAKAGGVITSPATGIGAVAFSRYLQERFSLSDSWSIYRGAWIVDKNHKNDPYVAYLSLHPDKNAVVITPKIYPDDKFKIMKEIFIVGPIILELKGKEYIAAWSYLMPAEAPETLKILELLPISPAVPTAPTPRQTLISTSTISEHPWSVIRHDAQYTSRSSYPGPNRPVLKWKKEIVFTEHLYSSDEYLEKFKIPKPLAFASSKDETIYLITEDKDFPVLTAVAPEGKLKWQYKIFDDKKRIINEVINVVISKVKRESNFDVSKPPLRPVLVSEEHYKDFLKVSNEQEKDEEIKKFHKEEIDKEIEKLSKNPEPIEIEFYSAIGNFPSISVDDEGVVYFVVRASGDFRYADRPSSILFSNEIAVFLYAINPDGSLKWRKCLELEKEWPKAEYYPIECSAPAVGLNGALYCTVNLSHDYRIVAFGSDGEFKWSFTPNSESGTPIITDGEGTVYFADRKGIVYALNPDGTIKWRFHTDQQPVLIGGKMHQPELIEGLITIGQDRVLYFATNFLEGKDFLYTIGEAEK